MGWIDWHLNYSQNFQEYLTSTSFINTCCKHNNIFLAISRKRHSMNSNYLEFLKIVIHLCIRTVTIHFRGIPFPGSQKPFPGNPSYLLRTFTEETLKYSFVSSIQYHQKEQSDKIQWGSSLKLGDQQNWKNISTMSMVSSSGKEAMYLTLFYPITQQQH